MKRTKKTTKLEIEEIYSLNPRILFNEFSIEELEERLETDPFLLTSLFNLGLPSDTESEVMRCACKNLNDCPELQCVDRNKA